MIWILLACYLIGSVPFGLILAKLAGKGDIRTIGSGNIGATNVLRTGSKKLALATLLLDFLKAFLPICFLPEVLTFLYEGSFAQEGMGPKERYGLAVSYSYALITLYIAAPIFILLGHMFPVWLKFKGGKGVACFFGCAYALGIPVGLTVSVGWLVLFSVTRISSVGALVGLPLAMLVFVALIDPDPVLPLTVPFLMILLKHIPNIKRLLKGEEPKFERTK